MRILVLSYIGPEEDIVETFVRHTLRFADKLIVVSVEQGRTREILEELQQEGLPLEIVDHQSAYHDQHEILTQLLRLHRTEADWFLPLDTDEFVTGDIRGALAAGNSQQIYALRWRTYVPLASDDSSEPNVLKRIRYRRAVETPQFTKVVIPSSAIYDNTCIMQGNHSITTQSAINQWGTSLERVELAHFPVRSVSQMTRKIERSWPTVLRNPHRKPDEAFHWHWMYEQYRQKQLTSDDLTEIALRYSTPADALLPDVVEDPVR